MSSISQTVVDFITLAIKSGGWMEMDRLYLQNKVLALIGLTSLDEDCHPEKKDVSSLDLLDSLVKFAREQQVINESLSAKEILEGQLMDLLTPPPSVVNALFAEHYSKNKEAATDFFFQLSQQNDYIKTRAIAKNIVFPTETEYGTLEITINLSKPEKDPRQIALEKQAKKVQYPKCMLCMENEGYLGRSDYPARTNHRIIRMNLLGESWGFQYSPYAYYNEHCIILAEQHRPMAISRETFQRLLTIVEVLPHYFVGSNADLPIVGGSILSHDHYQGGRHDFPMALAPVEKTFPMSQYPDIAAGIVKWPMSVIRLRSKDKEKLVAASYKILEKWRHYSDPSVSISAFSEDGTPHHTITPIARMKEGQFELDLVLRDNNVSTEYPDGIFHPHKEVQHIKKENIGLIEVMGLAVLPPRLKPELQEVANYLLGKKNEMAEYHSAWAQTMLKNYSFNETNVEQILRNEVGKIFKQVLENAGVFKRDEAGRAAFQKFIQQMIKDS